MLDSQTNLQASYKFLGKLVKYNWVLGSGAQKCVQLIECSTYR